MRKHRVTFLSPGTFVDESTEREICEWDASVAARLASEILERRGARPYGFFFTTALTADPVPDGEGGLLSVEPKEVGRSGIHYINGRICRADDFDRERDRILLSNMRANGWPLVVETITSYRSVHPFLHEDVVVDADGSIRDRGDSAHYVAYRARIAQELEDREASQCPKV